LFIFVKYLKKKIRRSQTRLLLIIVAVRKKRHNKTARKKGLLKVKPQVLKSFMKFMDNYNWKQYLQM